MGIITLLAPFKQKSRILSLSILLFITLLACQQRIQSGKTNASVHDIHIKNIETSLYPLYNLRGQEKPKSIAQLMQENKITGMSMAFVENGEVVWTKSYGYTNLGDSQPITPQTIFRAASLSKPITAMMALQLVESGKLELDQDINTYLTGWKLPENGFTGKQPVTVRNLIGHTSGIRNGNHEATPADLELPALEDILSGNVLNTPAEVITVPGETRKYSNLGYMVLGELLCDVTSKDLNTLANDLIFTPCSMNSSTFNQNLSDRFRERLAVGHDENQKPVPYYKHSSYGAGALYSTPTDLGKFLATILDAYHTQNKEHKVISHKMARQVFAEDSKRLGFNKTIRNGNFVFKNDGSIPGYNCTLMGSVTKNQAVVIMLNTGSEPAYEFLTWLTRAIALEYDWGIYEPEFYDTYEIPVKDLAKFVGLYSNTEDSILFELSEDHLRVSGEALVQLHEMAFLRPSLPMMYHFEPDSVGSVSRLYSRDERGDWSPVYMKVGDSLMIR